MHRSLLSDWVNRSLLSDFLAAATLSGAPVDEMLPDICNFSVGAKITIPTSVPWSHIFTLAVDFPGRI